MKTTKRRERPPEARKPALIGRRDLVPMVAASCAAAGIAVLCWSVLRWHDALAVAGVTYGAFVVALTGAIYVRSDVSNHVDIAEAERVEQAGVEDGRAPDEIGDRDAKAEPVRSLAVARPIPDPDLDAPASEDRPNRRRGASGADVGEALAAALGGAAIAEFLRVFLRMQSVVGVVIWWSVGFLVLYYLLLRDSHDRRAAVDRVVTIAVWAAGALVTGALAWMVCFAFARGLPKLAWSFFTQDLSKVGPLNPGGGARHAIIGTLEQVGIATAVVVPIAILTAVYLNELHGRLSKPVRFVVDAMSGLPSIVAGLLVFTTVALAHGFSGFAGSLALMVLMLPTVTRASEEILRTVSDSLREGALALGAPEWKLVQRVVLPTALPGLVTAAILGVARAIGETAPMLLTAFGADTTNTSPFHGPQDDLPLFVWKLVRSPENTQVQRGFTGAPILVMLIFVLFVIARVVASRGQRRLGRVR